MAVKGLNQLTHSTKTLTSSKINCSQRGLPVYDQIYRLVLYLYILVIDVFYSARDVFVVSRKKSHLGTPVSYTHLTLPTRSLV